MRTIRLAELPISGMHVQRITERLGRERAGQRDKQVEQFKEGRLAPAYAQPPAVAVTHAEYSRDKWKVRL
jgi:hypothetical protein